MGTTKEKDATRALTEHAEDLAMLGSLCSSMALLPLRSDETPDEIKERLNLSLVVHGVDPGHPSYPLLHGAMFVHFAVEREKLIRGFIALGDFRERAGKPRVACECMVCDSIAAADIIRAYDIKNKSGLMHILTPERYTEFCNVNDHMMVRLLDPTVAGKISNLTDSEKTFFQKLDRAGMMLSKLYAEFKQHRTPTGGLDGLLDALGLRREDVRVISVDELLGDMQDE